MGRAPLEDLGMCTRVARTSHRGRSSALSCTLTIRLAGGKAVEGEGKLEPKPTHRDPGSEAGCPKGSRPGRL